jgi:hypothetical protein
MDHHISGTHIQNKLLRYILQSFKYLFITSSYVSLSRPCIFLCFQGDSEYHYISISQDAFTRYDKVIANGAELTFLKLVLPQIYHVHHHFSFDIFLYDYISNATSTFQLRSFSECVVLL